MACETPVGIDLGTTYSAVATLDKSGRSRMITNAEGELLTPSIVLFADTEVVVGKEARSATTVHPDQVAEWVKRDMGRPTYHRPIHGTHLPPEVIQACILRKLRSDAVATLAGDTRVVITVPAYFDEPRRKATADAGDMAGLSVLDIVNEPTAAALAFGETLGYLSADDTGAKQSMVVMVYDLGGGTFDVTLLKLAPGIIQTIATDGDVQLGGHDWDERLVNYVAESFQKSHGVDPRSDPAALNRLYNAVVEAKHTLSARGRASVRIHCDGKTNKTEITRDLFVELTADLLERTSYTTRQLLADAKMDWDDIERVLLVGGSTRMPMVSKMLEKLSGITSDRTVNPDEAVARGAALYAGYLLAKQAKAGPLATVQVSNVNAHSLGVEGIDRQTLRKTNVILIPRNTSLPAKFTERFATKSENQRSIAIEVLEGESSLPGECTTIGRTVIHNLPSGLPKGWPVEVAFEYAANGRLSVQAIVPGTHQQATLELERAVGLSSEGVQRWKQPVTSQAGFDSFEAMVLEVVGEMEAESPSTVPRAGAPPQPAPKTQPAAEKPKQPKPTPENPPESDEPLPAVESSDDKQTPRTSVMLRCVFSILWYASSAILGLGLGYLLLSLIRPETFPLPW